MPRGIKVILGFMLVLLVVASFWYVAANQQGGDFSYTRESEPGFWGNLRNF